MWTLAIGTYTYVCICYRNIYTYIYMYIYIYQDIYWYFVYIYMYIYVCMPVQPRSGTFGVTALYGLEFPAPAGYGCGLAAHCPRI